MDAQSIRSIFLLALMLLACSSAQAATIYQYTGNNFTTIDDSPTPAGEYTTSMSVSGSFTVSSPLVEGGNDILNSITEYSFSDGRNELTEENSFVLNGLFVLDGTGDITFWIFNILHDSFAAGASVGELIFATEITSQSGDNATYGRCAALIGDKCNNLDPIAIDRGITPNPGNWGTAPVPVPASVWLFGSALGLLGWMRRRKAT